VAASHYVTRCSMLVQQGFFNPELTVGKINEPLAAQTAVTGATLYRYQSSGLTFRLVLCLTRAALWPRLRLPDPVAGRDFPRISLLQIQPAPRLQLLGMSSFTQPASFKKPDRSSCTLSSAMSHPMTSASHTTDHHHRQELATPELLCVNVHRI
jgi:hypothetical protein